MFVSDWFDHLPAQATDVLHKLMADNRFQVVECSNWLELDIGVKQISDMPQYPIFDFLHKEI